MTDIQKQPIPEEVGGGPSVAPADPPPYQTGPDQMQPPPPYPYGSTVYSTYPPVAAAYGPDPTPPVYPAYPPYPPGQGGHVADNLPPEGNMAYTGTECTDTQSVIVDSAFEDKTVRRAFIRKVFSVVTLQLLVTFSVVCVFTFSETVKTAVQSNIWVYISSYIIFMVVAMCLSVCSSFSRLHPWNLISLAVVTLSLSYMVGTVASFHNTTSVVIAMGATLVISFTIIIFSAQTRVDFTICNGIIIILAVDLLMFGFFSIFYYSSMLQILYGCLGALLYSLFLAVDCQLVMGREKYSLNPEEYVFGALIIYLDIIMIFLYILMILGGSSNN
ncbi:protein lifeguard 1-like [Astyanax mexicanus]|uniref:Protein lifeguard 1-like n=2 Tax=Astyanax mexicanus TaxID=7994 RepID=A0A8T2LQZ9_ASTMX|nr:protein lifeguard 1-like [Astyanax mexicanus]